MKTNLQKHPVALIAPYESMDNVAPGLGQDSVGKSLPDGYKLYYIASSNAAIAPFCRLSIKGITFLLYMGIY